MGIVNYEMQEIGIKFLKAQTLDIRGGCGLYLSLPVCSRPMCFLNSWDLWGKGKEN